MAITWAELGRRLKAAREASELRQEDVAKHLGVSRSAVAQMEAGNRTVSAIELEKLAYLFGRDLRGLISEDYREGDAITALFRCIPETTQRDQMFSSLRECIALGRELTNLERILEIDRDTGAVVPYIYPDPSRKWDAINQAKKVANAERRRLGLGSAPIADIAELLESQGIGTAAIDMPEDISGLTINETGIGLFVVVNRLHFGPRRTFSYAHEYAHVLLDRNQAGTVSRAQDDALREVRANAFAAEFLLPEEGARQYIASLGKGKREFVYAEADEGGTAMSVRPKARAASQEIQMYDVVLLSHYFGVSYQAAIFRLRNLGLIDNQQLEELLKLDVDGKGNEIARHFQLKKLDSEESKDRFRHRFVTLSLEAYRRDAITKSKLKELVQMVGYPVDDIDCLLRDLQLEEENGHDTSGHATE